MGKNSKSRKNKKNINIHKNNKKSKSKKKNDSVLTVKNKNILNKYLKRFVIMNGGDMATDAAVFNSLLFNNDLLTNNDLLHILKENQMVFDDNIFKNYNFGTDNSHDEIFVYIDDNKIKEVFTVHGKEDRIFLNTIINNNSIQDNYKNLIKKFYTRVFKSINNKKLIYPTIENSNKYIINVVDVYNGINVIMGINNIFDSGTTVGGESYCKRTNKKDKTDCRLYNMLYPYTDEQTNSEDNFKKMLDIPVDQPDQLIDINTNVIKNAPYIKNKDKFPFTIYLNNDYY